MGANFSRVNCVVVDPNFSQIFDGYLDAGFASTYAGNVASDNNPTATYGQLFRGMPVWISKLTGKIVPPNATIGTVSTSGSTTSFGGILVVDVTPFVVARNTKIALAKKGRMRSYAGGPLTPGDPVKPDISSNFSGFVKWNAATDDAILRVGYAWPLDDGSTTGTPATTIAQGDTIFVDL